LAGEAGLWTAFFWLPATAAEHLHVSLFTGCMLAMLVITWDAFRVGIFGYIAAVIRPGGVAAAMMWPTVWVALEWLWPHIFPWRLGHTQSHWIEAIQISELVGVYGISFLMVLATTTSARLLQSWLASRRGAAVALRPALGQAGACAAVLLAALLWGHWRIAQVEAELASCPQLTVALVQPGATGPRVLEICRNKSDEVAAKAELICWPESSVGDYSLSLTRFDSFAEKAMKSLAVSAISRPLLCGGGSFAPSAEREVPMFNTAFLLDADQSILGRYHKRALAPWGEYVVGQQWIPGLRELFGIHAEYRCGDSTAPLELPGRASLGVLICYEDLLEGHARQSVRSGAQVLFNLNNLSAFGHSPAQRQHQQLAQFRAVESRRYLLRCGTVGSTSVISATGRLVAQAPPHEAAVIVHAVPLLESQTIYTRWGDALAILCVVTIAIMFMAPIARRRC
jgi:apolipoprotein N-acyltransferase